MSTRDEYVRKMHSMLDKGNAEIDALAARMEHAEAGARDAYQKQIATLRASKTRRAPSWSRCAMRARAPGRI